jgi:hypothetical protein
VKHTFKRNKTRFICREELYVSDEPQTPHYRKSHSKNKSKITNPITRKSLGQSTNPEVDAELAGAIEVDMTFLRDQGHINVVYPSQWSAKPGEKNGYYAVEFDLVMIIDGRNLKYEARWPPTVGDTPPLNQHVRASGQVCIAAAFKPGTE